MARLILHIGHPKTGSTALQRTLSANAERLLEAGVLYPTDRMEGAHGHKHGLAKPYLTGRENFSLQRQTGRRGAALSRLSERYWAMYKAEARRRPHGTLILSCEGLWAVPAPQAPGFRERLAEVCDHVTVVAYLRSPARRFLSQVNQNVRMLRGVRLPPAEYYRPVVEAYAREFEAVALNLFEPARLAGGDIVADFCGKYLPADLPPLERDATERANESVSNEALAIIDDVRRTHLTLPPQVKDRRRTRLVELLRQADREVGGSLRPSLKPAVAAALVARSTDLPWLRDEAGVGFDDVDYGLVGTAGHPDLESLRHVEDICPVDPDRLAALRALTGREVARIVRADPLRTFLRRVSGALAP